MLKTSSLTAASRRLHEANRLLVLKDGRGRGAQTSCATALKRGEQHRRPGGGTDGEGHTARRADRGVLGRARGSEPTYSGLHPIQTENLATRRFARLASLPSSSGKKARPPARACNNEGHPAEEIPVQGHLARRRLPGTASQVDARPNSKGVRDGGGRLDKLLRAARVIYTWYARAPVRDLSLKFRRFLVAP